jgi:hypothetical protein
MCPIRLMLLHLSAYYHMCVLILPYVSPYYYNVSFYCTMMCPSTIIYVSSYRYVCVLTLVHTYPDTVVCV